jgi:hypothetical protein
VGSHYHLVEVNPRLELDRALAYGRRLNIPAGTAVRFEPGETKSVPAVLIGGGRVIRGGNSLGDGAYDPARAAEVARACEARGFKHRAQPAEPPVAKKARADGGAAGGAATMERGRYAGMFGPTTGDKVRQTSEPPPSVRRACSACRRPAADRLPGYRVRRCAPRLPGKIQPHAYCAQRTRRLPDLRTARVAHPRARPVPGPSPARPRPVPGPSRARGVPQTLRPVRSKRRAARSSPLPTHKGQRTGGPIRG